MSVATLDEITQKDWSANAFCDLLYATLGKTGDQGFHLLLATRAADHIDHLTAMGLFNGSDLSNELAPAFLRICVQRLNALQAELVGVRSNNGCQTALEGITSFFEYLGGKCCDFCQTQISCYIEGPTQCSESLYEIRCSACEGVVHTSSG